MNQSKLESPQLHQEFIKSLVEVRYTPYYSMQIDAFEPAQWGKITLKIFSLNFKSLCVFSIYC